MSLTHTAPQASAALTEPRRTANQSWFRRLSRNRLALTGLVIIMFASVVAILAPVLAPYSPYEIHAVDRLQGPSTTYYLGTDHLGRDVFSRLIFGSRISLGVGAATVFLCNIAGILVGAVSGYYRRLDNVLMRIMDAFMAFPGILLALGIMAILGASVTNVVIALSIVYTPRVARVVRSSVLVIRETDYVEAGRAIGLTDWRILARHVLPNAMAPIIVQGTFIFAYAVIAEASLSFLGVGSSPEIPSWGNMLSGAREFLRTTPMLAIFPGLAIMATVLSLNLLGDGLRDALDPHLKGREDPNM